MVLACLELDRMPSCLMSYFQLKWTYFSQISNQASTGIIVSLVCCCVLLVCFGNPYTMKRPCKHLRICTRHRWDRAKPLLVYVSVLQRIGTFSICSWKMKVLICLTFIYLETIVHWLQPFAIKALSKTTFFKNKHLHYDIIYFIWVSSLGFCSHSYVFLFFIVLMHCTLVHWVIQISFHY